jgi:hypothetical protein
MQTLHPSQFKPSLTQARLEMISQNLWEIYYEVASLLATEDDCGYTRGTAFFGRSRNRLINLTFNSAYSEWLKLTNAGMDVTLEIEGVPFRIFREDDHSNPGKKGFWRRNASDQLFAPTELDPVIFRFITEAPIQEDDSLEIYFIGYNSLEEPVCEWRYNRVVVLTNTSPEFPSSVEQQPAKIALPRKLDGDEDTSTKTVSS